MNFLLSQNNLWIVLIAVISGVMLAWPSLRKGRPNGRITLDEAIRQINQEHGVLVDVRPIEQFKAGTIPQARSIPLDVLDTSVDKLPKDKPIVFFGLKEREASTAVGRLRKQGFDQVSCLQGGLRTWTDSGLPLKKS